MSTFPEYEEVLQPPAGERPNRMAGCVVRRHRLAGGYALHHHDAMELSLVVDGTGVESINGVPHRLRPGSITFLRPHDMHEYRCDDGPGIEFLCCMFDMSLLQDASVDAELAAFLFGPNDGTASYVDLDADGYAEMKACLEKMLAEYAGDKPASASYVRAKLIECAIVYYRARRAARPAATAAARYRSNHWIWSVIRHVNARYLEDLSLESLARRFNAGESAISLGFREATGTTFLRYLHNLRVRRAAGLLLNTDLPIVDVAMDAGFQSFRTFSRVFAQAYGMPPRQFRQQAAAGRERLADAVD